MRVIDIYSGLNRIYRCLLVDRQHLVISTIFQWTKKSLVDY